MVAHATYCKQNLPAKLEQVFQIICNNSVVGKHGNV
jgi:hypothetical protein